MPRYRKIPVVIEARQFDGTVESGEAIVAWATENGSAGYCFDDQGELVKV